MKIIGWNINHRLGNKKIDMPKWVKKVIQNKKADIIVLTETSFKVSNWRDEYSNLVKRDEYYVFCSNNTDVGNNEVTIALKKDYFNVKYVRSFLSEDHSYPDHLEIHCIHKETKKKFVIIGMRIHAMNISDQQKKNEFCTVLKSVKDDENVIIVGDFNNYRRGYKNNVWCLTEIGKLAQKEGFSIHTPNGGSIYQDNEGDFSFPEDHILLKGQSVKITKLYDYDRSFVDEEPGVYIFGKDFQKYRGKDRYRKNMYDNIEAPFPDHAIVEADFDII